MGCDIHWVLEVKSETGKWVGVLSSEFSNVPANGRWYSFFSEFGVRGDSDTAIEPRGWPDDVSELTKLSDLHDHSHSWVTIDEFKTAYERAVKRTGSVSDPKALFGDFNWWMLDDRECRLIMAFDS